MKRHNFGILLGASLVIVGFFFGWLGLSYGGKSFSISGWEVAKLAHQRGWHYYLLYALPVGSLLAAVAALKDRQAAARLGTWLGGAFVLWGAVELARFLYMTTFLGLWLTVAGTVTLLAVGLATRRR